MNFPHTMGQTGIEKDPFSSRGFTSIDVRHDANIPGIFQILNGHTVNIKFAVWIYWVTVIKI
jgi:hypothetical protein